MLEAGGAVREFSEERMRAFRPLLQIDDVLALHDPATEDTRRIVAESVARNGFVLADFDKTDAANEFASDVFCGEHGAVLEGNRDPSDAKVLQLVLLVRGVVAELEERAGGPHTRAPPATPAPKRQRA